MDEIFPNLKKAINTYSRSSTKSKQDKSLGQAHFSYATESMYDKKKIDKLNMKIENFTELSVGEHAVK